MNPRTSSGLKKRCKHRGIKPSLRVRRPRVAEASAEAQALREGGLKNNKHFLFNVSSIDKTPEWEKLKDAGQSKDN
jgi:hypothetical protein